MKTMFGQVDGLSYKAGIIMTDGKEDEAPPDDALVSCRLICEKNAIH